MALTAGKAKKMLEDGTVHGRALTDKQKRYFGAIAGGATPMKKINGGWLDKYAMGGSLPGASGMMYGRSNTMPPLFTQSEMKAPSFADSLAKAQKGETVMYGTPEYEAAYKEGRFRDVPNPLDEVVVTAGIDYEKYPLYDKLSPQQKEYFFDDGAIGRGVRRAAQTDRGLYEDTLDVVNPILYTAIGTAGLMSPLGTGLLNATRIGGGRLMDKVINPALNFKPFNPGSYGGATTKTLAGTIRNRNILDAVGLGYGSYNLPEVSRNLYNDPSLSTAGDFALNTLNFLPVFDTSYRGITNSFNLRSGLNRTLERIKSPFRDDKNFMSTRPGLFGFGKGPKYDVQQFNLARTNSPAFMKRYDNYVYQQGDPTLMAQLNNFKRQERIIENQINKLLSVKSESLGGDVVRMADGSLEFTKPVTNFPGSTYSTVLRPQEAKAEIPGLMSLLNEKNLIQGQINRLNTTLRGAKYARQNLDKLQQTGVFTKIENPVLSSDLKYYADNPNTLGFYDMYGDLDRLPNTSTINLGRMEDWFPNPTVRYNKGKTVLVHEDGHALNAGGRGTKPIYSRDINAAMNRKPKGYDKLTPKEQERIKYLTKETEVHSRIDELRMQYIPKKYWGTDDFYKPSDDLLNKIISDGLAGKTSVDFKFFNLIGDKKKFKNLFKTLPALAAPIAIGSAPEGSAPQMKDGGRCWPGYKTVPGKTPFSKGSCQKAQDGYMVPPREGVRKNADGTESTHLMKAEQLEDGTWVGFPSLFQNADGKWIDMSGEKDWIKIYNEALKRGEVIEFGTDKEAAIKFGEGSWKSPKMKDGGWLDKYEVIEDDMGQLTNPGKITKINSPNITMKGVDFPVLGISNTGDKKMMLPGQDYTFDGESVTEYPIKKKQGGSLVKLNQLTNFTNYNTPQPGGWLEKYN